MCYTECWSKAAIGSVLFFTDTHTCTHTQTKWHSQHVLCSTVWYGREHSIDNWFQTSLVDSQCNFVDAELAKCGFFEFGHMSGYPNSCYRQCFLPYMTALHILHNRKIPGFSISKNSIQEFNSKVTGMQYGHSSCFNYFCPHLYGHVTFKCQSAEQCKRCGHTQVLQNQEHNGKNGNISVMILAVLGHKVNLYV